jgi:hypothetical protein
MKSLPAEIAKEGGVLLSAGVDSLSVYFYTDLLGGLITAPAEF